MSTPVLITKQDIVDYYDTCEVDYNIVWHLKSHLAMHYGYWEENTRRLRQALWRMNEMVLEYAKIENGHKTLDAGCGLGGSVIFAAQKHQCEAYGISLSQNQIEKATASAAAKGLDSNTHFSVQDYCQTNFPDNYFDAVWAIESVCHAQDKQLFLHEAHRILKKGGRLVIADFFKTGASFDDQGEKLLNSWANSWAVPHFEFIDNFTSKGRKSGFSQLSVRNITPNILPSAKRLYYCFVPGVICHSALWLLGRRSHLHKANVWSTYYQYVTLKKNLWNYYIVIAKKEN